jgi:hypothetical protein
MESYELPQLIICSRTNNYEEIKSKLRLWGIISIKPLTQNVIDYHLQKCGNKLDALRTMLREDPMLYQLLNTPFMLSIAILTYNKLPKINLNTIDKLEERRMLLFNDYIDAMFMHRYSHSLYTREQTIHWLTWLAQSMRDHGQTVFQLESLQPIGLSY